MKRMLTVGGVLVLAVAAGCWNDDGVHEVEVSGSATVDGEPIPQGAITFIAADGKSPAGGGVIKNGKYTAQVPPGEKIVLVRGNKVVGQKPADPTMPNSPMVDQLEMVTPTGYNAQHVTPLKANITEPTKGLDFDLDSNFKG